MRGMTENIIEAFSIELLKELARRHLSDLVKAGIARKVGEGPGTEYVVIE